jgi:uncharacterized protein (TIGR02145 family)
MYKMKKKIRVLNSSFFLIGLALVVAYSCKKDNSNDGNGTNGKTKAVFNSQVTYGSMTDQDGSTYKTVTIGTQTWMAENLRTTKYRNGEAIPEVAEITAWKSSTTGAYCNYNNSINFDTIATFGRLYNGYTVSDSRNIAPKGWHVPSDEEWSILITFLGGDTIAGSMLKEADTTHWKSPNRGTTNQSGFTALPAGYRDIDGVFLSIDFYSEWWSSIEDNSAETKLRSMVYFSNDIGNGYVEKTYGFSVRCLKDN